MTTNQLEKLVQQTRALDDHPLLRLAALAADGTQPEVLRAARAELDLRNIGVLNREQYLAQFPSDGGAAPVFPPPPFPKPRPEPGPGFAVLLNNSPIFVGILAILSQFAIGMRFALIGFDQAMLEWLGVLLLAAIF